MTRIPASGAFALTFIMLLRADKSCFFGFQDGCPDPKSVVIDVEFEWLIQNAYKALLTRRLICSYIFTVAAGTHSYLSDFIATPSHEIRATV